MFKNASFYKFVTLKDPLALKEKYLSLCRKLKLKGTILLADEGLNAMLSGPSNGIDCFLEEVEKDLGRLRVNQGESHRISFKRLLVKIKKEIITFKANQDMSQAAPYVGPEELHAWLKSEETITLLDTRNDFEVKLGTFKNAINPGLKSFTQFKEFIRSHSEDLKQKKVVTFCTGGIRCEKATAFMNELGFKNVYQLEGGILNYLKKTTGEFFDGECFVFDERVSVTK